MRLHAGDRAAFWVRDAEALTRWETAAPLRTLLRWALRGHGAHMVHAAAVVGPRGAALLAGPSGAGKSTTALAASVAGLGYIADDYCAVELGAPPIAHALCAVGKLETPWPRLDILPGGATPDGKQIVSPAQAHALRTNRLARAVARHRARPGAGARPAGRGAERARRVAAAAPRQPPGRPAGARRARALAARPPARHGPRPGRGRRALLAEHLA